MTTAPDLTHTHPFGSVLGCSSNRGILAISIFVPKRPSKPQPTACALLPKLPATEPYDDSSHFGKRPVLKSGWHEMNGYAGAATVSAASHTQRALPASHYVILVHGDSKAHESENNHCNTTERWSPTLTLPLHKSFRLWMWWRPRHLTY